MKSESDFSWLKKTQVWKEASSSLRQHFVEYMADKNYGQTETLDAFHHYAAGWRDSPSTLGRR